MFTEMDYINYFTAIQNAEKAMISGITNILVDLSDSYVIGILEAIRQDEGRHYGLTKELFEILKSETAMLKK
jgi:hypothetical protein